MLTWLPPLWPCFHINRFCHNFLVLCQLWRYQKTLTALENCSEVHGFAMETGFRWSFLYGLNCPIASSDGDVWSNCGLVQTTGLLFDCLSNPASLKDEMFSLARSVVRRKAGCFSWSRPGLEDWSQEAVVLLFPQPLVLTTGGLQPKEVCGYVVFVPQIPSSVSCCVSSFAISAPGGTMLWI